MVYLSKQQAGELLEQAKTGLPNEICGILAGRDGKIERIYPMTNSDKSVRSFFMDPTEQLKVIKEIRNLGLEMLGIYHSHPETEAYPSAQDTELAFYPEVSYIIISLKDKDNPGIRSFKIVEQRIEEEAIGYK